MLVIIFKALCYHNLARSDLGCDDYLSLYDFGVLVIDMFLVLLLSFMLFFLCDIISCGDIYYEDYKENEIKLYCVVLVYCCIMVYVLIFSC